MVTLAVTTGLRVTWSKAFACEELNNCAQAVRAVCDWPAKMTAFAAARQNWPLRKYTPEAVLIEGSPRRTKAPWRMPPLMLPLSIAARLNAFASKSAYLPPDVPEGI